MSEIRSDMDEHFLKLNKTKTKILVLAPPNVMSSMRSMEHLWTTKPLDLWVLERTWVCGWMKTSTLKHTFAKLFLPVLWCCMRYGKLRPFSQKNAYATIVCSLVLSKLDYCNALYYNINNSEHNLLQSVQNAAIRLIWGRFKYGRVSISPFFEQLHWLRIEERIVFKVCLIVHKCVWGACPGSFESDGRNV